MIQKCRQPGIDITLPALYAEEGDGILTRANFAACLMRRGIVASLNEAFEKYLDAGRPFYIPRKKLLPGSCNQTNPQCRRRRHSRPSAFISF